MRLWPFRQAILRSGARGSSDKYALPCSHLYHFGANDGLRGALQLTNLLTGWVQERVGGQAGRWKVACRWRAAGWAGPCACMLPAAAVHMLKASLAICLPVPLLCIQVRVPGGLRGAAALARQRHPFGSRARHAAALHGRVASRAGGGSGSSSKARWRQQQRQRGRCVTQIDVALRHVASWPGDKPEVAYSRSLTTLDTLQGAARARAHGVTWAPPLAAAWRRPAARRPAAAPRPAAARAGAPPPCCCGWRRPRGG